MMVVVARNEKGGKGGRERALERWKGRDGRVVRSVKGMEGRKVMKEIEA